jgi:hypothetical protein
VPSFEFTPQDTVYVSVTTEASSRGEAHRGLAVAERRGPPAVRGVRAAPRREHGVSPLQPKCSPGTYKVVVFLADDSVDTKVFVVKKYGFHRAEREEPRSAGGPIKAVARE